MINLPNVLSALRILAVLAIAVLLAGPWGPYTRAALLVFLLAAITDFLDGYFARAWGQVTALGRMLDSIADKLLIGVTLLLLCGSGTISGIHVLAAAIILFREIGVSGLREHLSEHGVVVPASMSGKWKMTLQLIALAALMAAPLMPFPELAHLSALTILWLAAALSVWSGAEYVWGSRSAWAADK